MPSERAGAPAQRAAVEPRRFVLLFEGRSGSTYLMESLDAHPQVVAAHEILTELKLEPDVARLQLERTRAFLTEPRDGAIAAVGFKTKLADVVDRDAFAALLRALDVRIIHLRRRNLIKLALSVLNAKRLRQAI